jgi:hypothetical protein
MIIKDHILWQHLLAITPVTVTSVFTCLGHLGRCNTDRIVSIYVAPLKVAKARLSCVAVAGIIALTFSNGNVLMAQTHQLNMFIRPTENIYNFWRENFGGKNLAENIGGMGSCRKSFADETFRFPEYSTNIFPAKICKNGTEGFFLHFH